MSIAAEWDTTTGGEHTMDWRWEHHLGRKHLRVNGHWLCGQPYQQPHAVLPCEHCLQAVTLMQRHAWDE